MRRRRGVCVESWGADAGGLTIDAGTLRMQDFLGAPAGIQNLESHPAALLYTAGSEKADYFGGLTAFCKKPVSADHGHRLSSYSTSTITVPSVIPFSLNASTLTYTFWPSMSAPMVLSGTKVMQL